MVKYPGKLGLPRPPLPDAIPLIEADTWLEKYQAEEFAHFQECYALLLAYHGVSPGPKAPIELLAILMRAHVPAFQRKRARGSTKSKWPLSEQFRLVAEVQILAVAGEAGVAEACRRLITDRTFSGTAEGLERRYQNFLKDNPRWRIKKNKSAHDP